MVELLEHGEAVLLGEHQVEHDEVVLSGERRAGRVGACREQLDLEAVLLEPAHQAGGERGVVLDEEQASTHPRRIARRRAARSPSRGRSRFLNTSGAGSGS